MLRTLSPFFLLLLFFTACDRENFDLIDESELPDELVIVEEEPEIFFRTILDNADTLFTIGTAKYAEMADLMLIVSNQSVDFDCPTEDDRSFGFRNAETSVVVSVYFDEERNPTFTNAYYFVVIGEELVFLQLGPCTPLTTSVNWTDDTVSGTVSGDAISLAYFNENGYPEPDQCDDFQRYPVSFDFRMPVTYCE